MKYPTNFRMDRAERYAVIILFTASLICFIIPELLQRAAAKTTIVYRQVEKAVADSTVKKVEEKPLVPSRINITNPNTISMDSLVYYGLDEITSQRLINFRAKGKVFYSEHDILQVFGMSKQKLASLAVQFSFDTKPRKPESSDVIIDVNTASESELQQLPGIGPVFAARIIKYRSLLGGYCRKEQLLEVYGFKQESYDGIKDKVSINRSSINRIDINNCDFVTLLRHPYISKNVCKAIINYREAHGNFNDPHQLLNIKIVDAELLKKIKPYLKVSAPALKEAPQDLSHQSKVVY